MLVTSWLLGKIPRGTNFLLLLFSKQKGLRGSWFPAAISISEVYSGYEMAFVCVCVCVCVCVVLG